MARGGSRDVWVAEVEAAAMVDGDWLHGASGQGMVAIAMGQRCWRFCGAEAGSWISPSFDAYGPRWRWKGMIRGLVFPSVRATSRKWQSVNAS